MSRISCVPFTRDIMINPFEKNKQHAKSSRIKKESDNLTPKKEYHMGSFPLALAALVAIGAFHPFPEKYQSRATAIILSSMAALSVAQIEPKKIYIKTNSTINSLRKKKEKPANYEELQKKFDTISPMSLDNTIKGSSSLLAATLFYFFLIN